MIQIYFKIVVFQRDKSIIIKESYQCSFNILITKISHTLLAGMLSRAYFNDVSYNNGTYWSIEQ